MKKTKDIEIYFKGEKIPKSTEEEFKDFIDEIHLQTNTENPLKNWQHKEYKTYTELKCFIESIKDKLIDQSLKQIWSMGLNYCDDRDYYLYVDGKWFSRYYPERYIESEGPKWDDNKMEDVFIELDEPIILFIGDTRFEIDYAFPSTARIGINSLTRKEKSYGSNENLWKDISKYYSSNIIGRTVKDIIIEKRTEPPTLDDIDLEPEREDVYGKIQFVMDNNFCFTVSVQWDYMVIYEEKYQKIMNC